MAKLTSRATVVIDQMKEDNKVTTLNFEQSAHIDHKLATGLREVKTQFEIKEKNSRAYVAQVELASFTR